MIYSILLFALLFLRNYSKKWDKVIVDSLILQVVTIVMIKKGLGAIAVTLAIVFIGMTVRRIQMGNIDGDRMY